MVLAKNIVHVTSDAKTRPMITALTRMSADRNIDHGDNSRRWLAAATGFAVFSGAAGTPEETGTVCGWTIGAAPLDGCTWTGTRVCCVSAAAPGCCARTGIPCGKIARTMAAPQAARRK